MSEPVEQQPRTGDGKAVSVSSSATSGSAASASTRSTSTGASSDTAAGTSTTSSKVGPSRALLGPFTLREVVFGAGVLVVFIGTLLPFVGGRILYTTFWSSAQLFFIGIGILLPVIALALLAGRRLGSSGLRVGSLSVDQFASITAVLAATFFFLQTVTVFQFGAFLALIGSLGLLAATVVGPFLPVIKDDFADRPDVAAHPLARPITAAAPRPPKAAKPTTAATSDSGSDTAARPAPAGASVSGTSPVGVRTADGTASRPVAPSTGEAGGSRGAGDIRGEGVTRVARDSAGVAGSAATTRSPITSGGAGRTASASSASSTSSAATAPQNGSVPSHPLSDGVTAPDGGHAGVRVGDASSDERDAEQGATSTSGSGRTPVARAVDVPVASGAAAVEETRVHEPVRDDEATRSAATPTSNTSGSGGERSRQEPITATRSADEEQVVEAFWFAVGSPRPVFDEQTGKEIFVLQPGDWEVGIEDRGGDFLVQDKRTGAVGILRDLRNIERAPRD